MDKKNVLIEVKDLSKHFNVGRNLVLKAVDDVTFNIYKGETFGVVGESGCGKTTCGRTVLGMYDATKGQVLYEGKDIHSMNKKERFDFKKKAQYIFQDPYASLDPRMTIGSIIAEGMDVHFKMTEEERQNKIDRLLNIVGLNKEHGARFPHELSGGQRQRVGIARSLAVEPEFIVCDEPISALDVSIQAQIVNLLNKLQNEMGLTYMFISHDLSMVKHISDRIAVMYLGSVAELAQADMIYEDSLHPYTQALISAIPVPDPHVGRQNKRIRIEGEVPSPINVPPGCKFAGRCPKCMDICRKENPRLREVKPEHFVACHLYDGKNL
ncbi:oligopeptide transport system ATP-binding protein [Ezakiella coagulans]|uniref:Oligopeptide transport system ATP-binding protein n=1 Tax=Ezakiella coagulans TaxID=46507 RepID=A0A2U1DMX8_9FIRM|nr:oligopeptide/dipeptide ABC transporter ATP-binding protein [Ezakiella coagulans]KGF06589.1 peptide ABC transporter ATP-binding protein [Tissierellia bacterium S7-1-4]PVY88902.1 oligopeptide transport system ATP-binding protein [Ezakiella coagulans]UQK60139.1 ATP-binding cassette domain-containing protein [Ezakiella coagulans]